MANPNTIAGHPLKQGGLDLSRPVAPVDEEAEAREIARLKEEHSAARATRARAEHALFRARPDYLTAISASRAPGPGLYDAESQRRVIAHYNRVEGVLEEAHAAEGEALRAYNAATRERERRRVLLEWVAIDTRDAADRNRREAEQREAILAGIEDARPALEGAMLAKVRGKLAGLRFREGDQAGPWAVAVGGKE